MSAESLAVPAVPSTGRQIALRWAGKGFWAILDQGLFAGSNFILNILLARWLAPAEYGVFAVAFAFFLLLGTFHTALLTQPMLVFGAGRFKERLPEYMGALLWGHCIYSGFAGLLLGLGALASWSWGSSALAVSLGSLALAQPFIFLLWLARRVCYIRSEPRRAALTGLGYLVLMLPGVIGLYRYDLLSIPTAMLVMAGSSLFASGLIASRLSVRLWSSAAEFASIARQHAGYARWALPMALLAFLPGHLHYFILPIVADMGQVGAFRAMMNLVMPLFQANAAICVLLLPLFVRAATSGKLLRSVGLSLVLLVPVSAVAGLVIALLREPLMSGLYGEKYLLYSSILWLIVLLPVVHVAYDLMGASVQSIERPDIAFKATAIASIPALVVGIPAIMHFGLSGAALSQGIAPAVAAAIISKRLLQVRRS